MTSLASPALVVVVVLAGCAPQLHIQPRTLVAADHLSCRGYLVSRRVPIHDVILAMGGTGTGTSAFVPDVIAPLLARHPVALATFDKPGIRARFGDRASTRIDDNPLSRHTQRSLLDCADQLLRAATAAFGPNLRIHLRGHSEGALLALALLDHLLADRPTDADHIASLVLSGVPLEPFATLLDRQLANLPVLRRAVATCDWPTLRATGVSCTYLADARARPSGRTLFAQLATHSPTPPIHIFQGHDDFHTPASFMHDLEAWNAATGHLDLTVHYYAGGHLGTPAVREQMTRVLEQLITRNRRVSTPVLPLERQHGAYAVSRHDRRYR